MPLPVYNESGGRARSVGPLRWSVEAWQSRETLTVEVDGETRIKEAISICETEISLIESAIKRNKIPFPKRVPTEWPRFPIKISGPSKITSGDDGSPKHIREQASPGISRLRLSYWLRRAAERRHLETPLQNLMKTVPNGAILVVAKSFIASAAADLVRENGRTVIVLEPGYGSRSSPIVPSSLQKPAPRSLISWLCENGGELGGIGAALFVGDGPFDRDVAALLDACEDLPIFALKKRSTQSYLLSKLGPMSSARSISSGELPKISIVTVSFNQAPYLEQTIRSVLDQDYPNLEYIVVDGGSTDGSVQIIDRYRSRFAAVVIEPDGGQSDALNKGFRLSTGNVMNWLCSDDLLEPGALHRVAKTYMDHGTDLIVGGCVRIGEQRSLELLRHHTAIMMGDTIELDAFDVLKFMRSWQRGHYFYQPEVFFSRRIWEAAGAFIKTHLFYAMDYDLWLRMALAGASVRHVPAFLGCSRVHALQKTQDDQVYLHQMRQIMEEFRELFESLAATLGETAPISRMTVDDE